MNFQADAGSLGYAAESVLQSKWLVADTLQSQVSALTGLALRNNPKRAQLIVSKVLAKHIPTTPEAALEAAEVLSSKVESLVGRSVVVMGFCETATGLGHAVAQKLNAPLVNTTRRPLGNAVITFEEPHSHATAHFLAPKDKTILDAHTTLVLVDDELSTGTTALNTIEAFEVVSPYTRYVIATLTDVRTSSSRESFAARVKDMNVEVDVVSVLDGSLEVAPGALQRVAEFVSVPVPAAKDPNGFAEIKSLEHTWSGSLGGRGGITNWQTYRSEVARLRDALRVYLSDEKILIVGDEELMGLPLDLACSLSKHNAAIRVQSTTRSPVHALDIPGYAIRRTLEFPAILDPSRVSFLHNVQDPESTSSRIPYDHIVLVTEETVPDNHPLLTRLCHYATTSVIALSLKETL